MFEFFFKIQNHNKNRKKFIWVLKKQQIRLTRQKIGYLIIYWIILSYYEFVNNFSALLLCKINVFNIFNVDNFFSDFTYIAEY